MLDQSVKLELLRLMNQAGGRICELYQDGFIPSCKADGSPVTQADREVDAFLQTHLQHLTPGVLIISEEGSPFPKRVSNEAAFWLLDPLDGTRSFVDQTGQFVISLALIEGGKPTFGMIHVPLTGETYMAYEGKAWRIQHDQHHFLRPQPPPLLWTALVGSQKHRAPKAFQELPISHVKQIQSALKFCWLADGRAQLLWRFAPCYEWDIAAGHALLEAVGGSILSMDGHPIVYGQTSHYYYTKGLVSYGTQEVQRLGCKSINVQTC